MKKNLIITISSGIAGFIVGYFCNRKNKKTGEKEDENKFRAFFNVLNKWMQLKEEGITLEKYFLEKGYRKIAIYGVSHLGNHLITELEATKIEIAFGIDRRAEQLYANFPIYGLDDSWDEVDVIVVTPIYEYIKIKEFLNNKVTCPIVSLEEVVFGK